MTDQRQFNLLTSPIAGIRYQVLLLSTQQNLPAALFRRLVFTTKVMGEFAKFLPHGSAVHVRFNNGSHVSCSWIPKLQVYIFASTRLGDAV